MPPSEMQSAAEPSAVRHCLCSYAGHHIARSEATSSPESVLCAVYHVTENGWKKVTGTDVGLLHYELYPKPEDHPAFGIDPLGPPVEAAA